MDAEELWIVVSWSFYPIAFLAPELGLSGAAAEVGLQVGYTIADLVAKVGLGICVFHIASLKSEDEGWSAEGRLATV